MASRGRGRGRGFINRPLYGGSDDVLPPVGQPPPLYPPLKFKPVPLPSGKRITYLLNLKREIRSSMRESAYFIRPASAKKDIERYTDKYQQIQAADEVEWDKSLFPKELFEVPARKKKKVPKKSVKKEAIIEKLKALEDKEDTEEKDESEESGEEAENEEEADDEELEEENDYAQSYFDNGENYLDDEDDNLDEGYE